MAYDKFNPDDLLTQRGRASLKPRKNKAAYYRTVSKGHHIGFRPSEAAGAVSGSGTWLARYCNIDGKLEVKTLGALADYDAAKKAADKMFKDAAAGLVVDKKDEIKTVEQACKGYVALLRGRPKKVGAANDADARFKRLVYMADAATAKGLDKDDPRCWFGCIPLNKLKNEHVQRWFDWLTHDADPDDIGKFASANRQFNSLRAAFNWALHNGKGGLVDDKPWRIETHTGTNRARAGAYLSKGERKLIILGDNMEAQMREFCAFLALSGLRPGAVAALRVRDFDTRKLLLSIGKDKAGAGRIIQVSDKAAPGLKKEIKNKLPDDLIFSVEINRVVDGKETMQRVAWRKDLWKDRFRAAADRAADKQSAKAQALRDAGNITEAEELEESARRLRGATLYCLRHSAISDMVEGGLPIHSVAKTCGTSLEMVEAHYGHLSIKTRDILNSLGY